MRENVEFALVTLATVVATACGQSDGPRQAPPGLEAVRASPTNVVSTPHPEAAGAQEPLVPPTPATSPTRMAVETHGRPALPTRPRTADAVRQFAVTQPPTNTVVLAFLTSGNPPVDLPPDCVETPILQTNVCGPCTSCFDTWDAAEAILPVTGCPLAYTFWEVEVLPAPITIQNVDITPGILTVNLYSDNVYVYQQQVTVLPGAFVPVSFGALALGYVSSDSEAYMPISITMSTQGAHMVALLDTGTTPTFRNDGFSYARVAGFGVHLLPIQ